MTSAWALGVVQLQEPDVPYFTSLLIEDGNGEPVMWAKGQILQSR